jgi:outer membrane protein assembly factor BamD (BamD/ComL family)
MFLFLLLAAAAAILISCATVARRPVQTAELFDSTVKSPADSAPGHAALPCIAPVAPDTRAAAAAASSEAVSGPGPGYEVSIPVAHAAPRSRLEPRVTALNLPRAPVRASSAAQEARKEPPVSAPAVKPPASAPVIPAAAAPAVKQPAPMPVLRDTVPGVSLSDSNSKQSPAVAGAGSTNPSQAAAQTGASANGTYGRLREIYARQGDEVQIGLDGTGFLFLGFPDKTPQGDGMSFKGKENRNNKTWFSFQPLKLGTYDLDFLRQNNSTGQSTRETVRVHVVSDQEFSLAVNQQQAADQSSGGQAEPGDTAFAERLSGIGANEAAIAELLKGYKDGNPALNDQIASLYMRTRAYDAAGKYYQKNISPQTSYTTSAVLGLVHIAIAQKDQQAFMSYLKQFLAVQAPAMEETLIQAARMEKEKGETGVALDLAGEYTTRYPQGKWRDEATFLMAQILEADSRYRDIARARDLYLEVAQSYPEGAFASLARERLLYLERHFFEVR